MSIEYEIFSDEVIDVRKDDDFMGDIRIEENARYFNAAVFTRFTAQDLRELSDKLDELNKGK
ncbi:MAG: hypothetical protein COB69_00235 [Phycisphaera sp.]|nr:MAG: hypothetical protein COB69_00235 [Phycisphaera sp.]